MTPAQKRLALTTAALLATGCGRGGGANIEFTKAALQAVPTVNASSAGAALRFAPAAVPGAPSTVAEVPALAQLFKLECQHTPDTNYCPPTVHPTDSLSDPTRFEMGALIGMIFHAQLYTGEHVTDCSGGGFSSITVSPASYAAGNPADTAADPTRFVLAEYPLYSCRSTNVSSASAEARVLSATAGYQAALHTRYRYDTGNGPQTDFFQVDVSLDGDSPTQLAFNFAAATPHASRIVLLASLVDHRFALKYYVPAQGGGQAGWVVAVGVGGFDLTTGVANVGHYVASLSDGTTHLCVDNVGGLVQADASSCAADGVPITWTSVATIRDYLGLDAATATRFAPYLAVFGSDAALTASDAWQTAGDDQRYWPAAIR